MAVQDKERKTSFSPIKIDFSHSLLAIDRIKNI
jgi:hypothetical protein